MPIIDRQRRLRQAGRIRLGEKVPTSNGKSRPSKIDVFRFTSADEESIRAVAAVYGGEVSKWEDAPVGEQWELKSESKVLDVLVPPVDLAYSQWYEEWSGGGCIHRCDGQFDVRGNCPVACVCDPDNRACKPTTRLAVIITAVDGIGTWRLETKGNNAADELDGAIEILRVIQSKGRMVSARLLLEQRQQKKINEKTGKPETFNFAVPVLDLKVPMAALMGAQSAPAQIESGVTPIARPVTELPSIAEQVHAVEAPAPRPQRSNSAAAIPSTGLVPRAVTPAVTEEAPEPTPQAQAPKPVATTPSMKRLFAIIRGNKNIPSDDAGRHAWASGVLDRTVSTFSDLTQTEVSTLSDSAAGLIAPKVNEAPQEWPDGEEPF